MVAELHNILPYKIQISFYHWGQDWTLLRVTGGFYKNLFARKAKKIMVDIVTNELNKKRGLKIDLKLKKM